MDYKIFSPTYRRPTIAVAHKYLTTLKYAVCESQAAEYRKHIPESNIWVVPDSAQGNVSRIRNYILDHAESDCVLIVDDDLTGIGQWDGIKSQKFDEQEAYSFIDNGFTMAADGNFHLWGFNCVAGDRGQYQDYCPFSFKRPVLGPFSGHYKNECRYDERFSLKEDYDMSLQVLHRYRWLLRFNWCHYFNDFHSLTGGCASYRTLQREKEQLIALQKKWGKEIVREDNGAGRVTKKRDGITNIDPLIRPPIKGV